MSDLEAYLPLDDTLRSVQLTEREIQIVRLWLEQPHLSRGDLASLLAISSSALRSHLNHIRRKLYCRAQRGAAAIHDAIVALLAVTDPTA